MNFSIGEFAIVQNFENHEEIEGSIVKVDGPLQRRQTETGEWVECYLLDIRHDGKVLGAKPHQLRKLPAENERMRVMPWFAGPWRPIPGLVNRLVELSKIKPASALTIAMRGRQA